jgi:acetyltransferase-like isoleucine patch superfamily enzyme
MGQTLSIGHGLVADDGVIVGYRSGRGSHGRLRLGIAARLRSGTVVYEGSTIGDRFETGHHVIIREDVLIGDGVSIWSNSVVDYGCVIGDKVKIHAGCYVAQFSQIEASAFLAPGVVLTNDLHPGRPGSAEVMAGPLIKAGAQIGANVTILPYVTVGSGALIGAGSIVTRDVPPNMVAYGCPAVPVRSVDELEPVAQRIRRAVPTTRRPGEHG